MKNHSPSRIWLVLGDLISLLIVTAIGFASHNTLRTAGTRILATFIPLVVAWTLTGIHLGLFDTDRATDPRQLWRPVWAMVFAAPLASWMRGLWLDSSIIPVIVAVIGGVSGLGMLVWRTLYWGIWKFLKKAPHG